MPPVVREVMAAAGERHEALPRLQLQEMDVVDMEDAASDTEASTASSASGVSARGHGDHHGRTKSDRLASKLEHQTRDELHEHLDLHLTS